MLSCSPERSGGRLRLGRIALGMKETVRHMKRFAQRPIIFRSEIPSPLDPKFLPDFRNITTIIAGLTPARATNCGDASHRLHV
jgi:hypothetical protein